MERIRIFRLKLMSFIGIMTLLMISMNASAQTVTYLNDKSKTYQIRSMENGKWEFHPGLYYNTMHKKYSGGYWKGLNIRWDASKSNVGQIYPQRLVQVAEEAVTAERVQHQIDSIKPIADEETLRSAERMVDLIYNQYESKFKKRFDQITEATDYAFERGNQRIVDTAIKLREERDLIQEEIDYVHEQGPTKQMEQAKRQLAYEDILKKLDELREFSYNLAYYAFTINVYKQSKQ